jgi:hypothetical protein
VTPSLRLVWHVVFKARARENLLRAKEKVKVLVAKVKAKASIKVQESVSFVAVKNTSVTTVLTATPRPPAHISQRLLCFSLPQM